MEMERGRKILGGQTWVGISVRLPVGRNIQEDDN